MDENSNKRATPASGFSRRRLNSSFQESKVDNGGVRSCNRLGCSTRYNSTKSDEISSTEKIKSSRTTFHPSNKITNGNSSKSSSSSGTSRKLKEQRTVKSVSETVSVESSSRQERIDESEINSTHVEMADLESVHTDDRLEEVESESLEGSPSGASGSSRDSRRSNITTRLKSRKEIDRGTSRNSMQPTRPSQRQGGNAQRHGLRNMTCTSITDILSSGCSVLDSRSNRTETSRRRHPDGETSTSRGTTRVSSVRGNSDSFRTETVRRPAIFDHLFTQSSSQRSRNLHTSRDDAFPGRTQRTNRGSEMRLSSEQGDDHEALILPQESQTRLSVGEAAVTRLTRLSHREATTRQPSFSNNTARGRQVTHVEDGSTQRSHVPLADRQISQHFSTNGIAQVLFALEMIEQEDLSYEQLLALENNFLLGALGFHDQHREMRLDIDDMSYEDLLALGEKMGTVSTALSEEALLKCLKRSIYQHSSTISESASFANDDIKCSICQEEYAAGEEVGKLSCEHMYHVDCIHQWLRQKNWCPICKTCASPS